MERDKPALPAADGYLEIHTPDQFRDIWFGEWRFTDKGRPEDAANYVWEVLLAISRNASQEELIEIVGNQDGLYDFIFQWLDSAGLVTNGHLSPKAHALLVDFEHGVHYPIFGL